MVARPADLPLWFKVTTDLPEKRVWARDPDLRLWLWLLAKAKRANDGGQVRFSYSTVCADLAVWQGTKRVKPTKKQVRAALLRLARDGNVTGTEGAHRRAQGRAQGYFVVTLCEWGIWYDIGDEKGTSKGTSTGSGRERNGHWTGTPRSDPESETDCGSPDRGLVGTLGSDPRMTPGEVGASLLALEPNTRKPEHSPRKLGRPTVYLRALHAKGRIDDDEYAALLDQHDRGSPGELYAALHPLGFNDLAHRCAAKSGSTRSAEGFLRKSLATAMHEFVEGGAA